MSVHTPWIGDTRKNSVKAELGPCTPVLGRRALYNQHSTRRVIHRQRVLDDFDGNGDVWIKVGRDFFTDLALDGHCTSTNRILSDA
jgi:hypothetical protein